MQKYKEILKEMKIENNVKVKNSEWIFATGKEWIMPTRAA